MLEDMELVIFFSVWISYYLEDEGLMVVESWVGCIYLKWGFVEFGDCVCVFIFV